MDIGYGGYRWMHEDEERLGATYWRLIGDGSWLRVEGGRWEGCMD